VLTALANSISDFASLVRKSYSDDSSLVSTVVMVSESFALFSSRFARQTLTPEAS